MNKFGYIGELFVKCELLRLGFEVYSSDNPSQKDWDLIILRTNNNIVKKIKIQVKTIDWNNKSKNRAINGHFGSDADFDFLIIVILNYSVEERYKVFVIPKEDLKNRDNITQKNGLVCKNDKKLLFTNKTITFNFNQDKDFIENKYQWNYDMIGKRGLDEDTK